MNLTPQEAKCLEIVMAYMAENGWAPSVAEVAQRMGLHSTSSAQKYLSRLATKNIVILGGSPRQIRIHQTGQLNLPVPPTEKGSGPRESAPSRQPARSPTNGQQGSISGRVLLDILMDLEGLEHGRLIIEVKHRRVVGIQVIKARLEVRGNRVVRVMESDVGPAQLS